MPDAPDPADELERIGNECYTIQDQQFAHAAARELRALRAEIERLTDAWIWESSSWKYEDWKAPDEFTAWIPSHKAIGVRAETFKTRDEARAAIRKAAAGIGGAE